MLRIFVACLLSSAWATDKCLDGDCEDAEGSEVLLLQSRVHQKHEQLPVNGNAECPCVGIQQATGQVNVSIGTEVYPYPRDTASSCKAWDDGRHPSCSGEAPASWCATQWCYVDPCNCNADAVGASPKKSTYFPDSKYQGRDLYYSYATCDGSDTFSNAVVAEEDKAAIATICEAKVDEAVFGNTSCPCVGVSGRSGTTNVNISGEIYDYPGTYGTTCSANDQGLPPDCNADAAPGWCSDSWCYVDPCNCKIDVLPKYTSYIAGSTVGGRPVYYSYATCASSDGWTSAEKTTADQAAIDGICA